MIKNIKKVISVYIAILFLGASIISYFIFPSEILAQENMCDHSSADSSPNLSAKVGGVSLDQAATFLADMTDITGAYYDADQDRIVFVGKKNTSLPKFDKDDMAVAIKAVVFNNVLPAVSMESDPADPNGPNNKIYYYGGIEDTRFGKVLVDADYQMKKYEFGYDENQNVVISSVPGYKSVLKLYLEKNPSSDFSNSSRFVLRPDIVSLKRDDLADAFIFDQVKMKIYTEPLKSDNDPLWNQSANEFVAHHTQNYDLFAQETPSYAEAKQLGKIVAVIKWIYDNNIASDFTWAKDFTPTIISTPRYIKKIISPEVQGWVMSGGVEYYTPNTYNIDDGTSAAIKTASESVGAPKEDVHWTFTKDGQQYEAVAVAADAFRSLGGYSRSETDFSIPLAGDLSLNFQRTYSSFSGGQQGIGRGWSFLPAQLINNVEPNSGFRAYCTGETLTHRRKLAFQSHEVGRESFEWWCSTGFTGFKPDDPVYHSVVFDSDDRRLITVRLKDQTEYTFYDDFENLVGKQFKLITKKDKNGNKITYNYDSQNRLSSISDDHFHQLTITYNDKNLISLISDWTGRSLSYSYDDQGNLITVTDPKGAVTKYSYNENNKLVSITDRDGNIILQNAYTTEAKIATQKDASGRVNTFNYDFDNKTITQTDNLSRITKTIYDDKSRVLQQIDPLNQNVIYTYGIEYSPVTITDKRSNKIINTYDQNGNLTSVLDPNSKKISYEYDSKNRLTRILDGRFGTTPKDTRYTYDSLGNLTQLNEAGRLTNFTYDLRGELLSSTNNQSQKTSWTRDSFGNPLTETDPQGNTTNYQYDVFGRLLKQIDPDGKTTSFTYDANNNILAITDAIGTTNYNYSSEGKLLKTTLANNSTSQFNYNMASSLTTVTDALGSTTNYTYDIYQNLTKKQDALNRFTEYSYDPLNRQTQEKTPGGKIFKWEYDPNGNLSKRIDAAGNITTYSYDVLNRLVTTSYPDGKTINFTYDDRGNITKMVDPSGTTTYVYDLFNRLLKVINPFGEAVNYTYDSIGNLIKTTYPDNKTVSYLYDSNNRINAITDWNNQQIQYTYYKNGLTATKFLPNSILAKYNYDNANRLTTLEYTKSDVTLAKFTYQRDNVGNISKVIEEGPAFNANPSPQPSPIPQLTYHLQEGWNLLGIPIIASTPDKLLPSSCPVIAGLDAQTQQLQIYSSIPELGIENTLTKINSGQGYYMYCLSNVTFNLFGLDSPNYITVYPGMQFVTVPLKKNSILAEDFLQELSIEQPTRSCPVILKNNVSTGQWDIYHVKGSTTDNNFNLVSQEAYLLLCE